MSIWESERPFILRRPYVWLLVVAAVAITTYAALTIIKTEPAELKVEILETDLKPVKAGQNTTFTVSIQNQDSRSHLLEIHIVYSSPLLLFYEERTGAPLPEPTYNGQSYTIVHPTSKTLGGGERLTMTIRVKGLDPGVDSYIYVITIEAYSDGKFSDRKRFQLTIVR
ncbi:MAG: hypothetical protein QXI32_04105 [Candidatus Bathyarchaeia archaeon]